MEATNMTWWRTSWTTDVKETSLESTSLQVKISSCVVIAPVLAAKGDKPILLVNPDNIPHVIQQIIKDRGLENFYIMGRPVSIGNYVVEQLERLVGNY